MVKVLDCTLRDGGYVNDWRFAQKSWRNIVKALVADESGATAVEYALMSSLIALILIASLSALGTRLGVEFNEVSSALK